MTSLGLLLAPTTSPSPSPGDTSGGPGPWAWAILFVAVLVLAGFLWSAFKARPGGPTWTGRWD